MNWTLLRKGCQLICNNVSQENVFRPLADLENSQDIIAEMLCLESSETEVTYSIIEHFQMTSQIESDRILTLKYLLKLEHFLNGNCT